MSALDWLFAALGGLAIARGFWRGAISQIFGIVGVVGGFLLASATYEDLAGRIARAFPTAPQPHWIGFAVVLLLTWFAFGCLGYWCGSLFRRTGLGCLDRAAGSVLGAGKAVLTAVIVVASLTLLLPPGSPLLRDSRFAPAAQILARWLIQATPANVQRSFEEKGRRLREFWFERDKPPSPGKTTRSFRSWAIMEAAAGSPPGNSAPASSRW
jgi:membrane protein required for colicin V production